MLLHDKVFKYCERYENSAQWKTHPKSILKGYPNAKLTFKLKFKIYKYVLRKNRSNSFKATHLIRWVMLLHCWCQGFDVCLNTCCSRDLAQHTLYLGNLFFFFFDNFYFENLVWRFIGQCQCKINSWWFFKELAVLLQYTLGKLCHSLWFCSCWKPF